MGHQLAGNWSGFFHEELYILSQLIILLHHNKDNNLNTNRLQALSVLLFVGNTYVKNIRKCREPIPDFEWVFVILKNIMEQVITLKQTATNFFNFPIILVLNCE